MPLKKVVGFFTDAIAIIGAVVFKFPSKTFDTIVGSNKDEYLELAGNRAIVTESVTKHSGKVRYSGSDWRARLTADATCDRIDCGCTVIIESVSGNVLSVKPHRDISTEKP